MSSGVVAAGAAAFAIYIYLKRVRSSGIDDVLDLRLLSDTHALVEHPPNTCAEAFYLFKEGFRYMYQTLGRWNAVDLFLGLAYLSQRPQDEYVAVDIAKQGRLIRGQEWAQLREEIDKVRRYMLYCQGLRHVKPDLQRQHWQQHLHVPSSDILLQQATAGLLRPAFCLVRDPPSKSLLLCIRGTTSLKDMFTSLTGAAKPHHQVEEGGVVLGYSHLGMLAAARWILNQVQGPLVEAAATHPGYKVVIIGHSMGGGTAALLTMMMREKVPALADVRCLAIACPACMTLELAQACSPYVTTILNGADLVPTFCAVTVDNLRRQVTSSSWFAEFQKDMRLRISRVVSGGLSGVGSLTQRTTRAMFNSGSQDAMDCSVSRQSEEQLAGVNDITSGGQEEPLVHMEVDDLEEGTQADSCTVPLLSSEVQAASGSSLAREMEPPFSESVDRNTSEDDVSGPTAPMDGVEPRRFFCRAALPSLVVNRSAWQKGNVRRRVAAGKLELPSEQERVGNLEVTTRAGNDDDDDDDDDEVQEPSTSGAGPSTSFSWQRVALAGMQAGNYLSKSVGHTSRLVAESAGVLQERFTRARPTNVANRWGWRLGLGGGSTTAGGPKDLGCRDPLATLDGNLQEDSEGQGHQSTTEQLQVAGFSAVVEAVGGNETSSIVAEEDRDAEKLLSEQGAVEEAIGLGAKGSQKPLGQGKAGTAGSPSPAAGLHESRQLLYPAGRILHLMPLSGVKSVLRELEGQEDMEKDSNLCEEPGTQGGTQGATSSGSSPPAYVVFEVRDNSAYNRLKLCGTMVLDHFIPSYIRAIDHLVDVD